MKKTDISRREFVNISAKGTAAFSLGATISSASLLTSCMNEKEIKTVHGACYHDCPDTCSWTVSTQKGKIIDFKPSETNPFTAGKLCSKMNKFPDDVTFHPDRILTPLKRTGDKGEGKFEKISWEQAISEVAQKLKTIIAEKGAQSVLPYAFAGTEGLVQKNSISARFFAHIGASKLGRTICGSAAATGSYATMGSAMGILPEDIVHSRYIIIWGTNTVLSNQHLWPFIEKARNEGAKIVVIDPFKSRTAEKADWYIPLKPGTDTALALGMMHVILREKLQDQDFIDQYTSGIDKLKAHLEKYDAKTVAEITDVEPDTIIQFAREYAKAQPSLIRVLIGMEHQANGASAFQAVAMLPALTGAWRYHGGGLLHMTYELFGKSLNWEAMNIANKIEKPDTRTISMIQIGKSLNDPEVGIHAMLVFCSNPAVIAPDQNMVVKGLKREDLFTVVLEHFMTDTARYADYIFPATSQLEHWDLMESWGQDYINLNQPAIEPMGEAKTNTEFFRLLAKSMGFEEEYLYESDLDIIKKTLDSNHAYLKGIDFDYLVKHGWAKLKLPEPWTPYAEGNFSTPSGKCEFYSTILEKEGLSPLPEYHAVQYADEELKNYPLQLLTVKNTGFFLNSSHANVDRLLKKQGDPWIDINQMDADSRGITEGNEVKVYNQRGEVYVKARISKKVQSGIVCMPQGFWSSLMKGGSSANALTSDAFTDMGEGAAFHDTRVEIVKV